MSKYLFTVILCLFITCDNSNNQVVRNPMYPGKAETHVVELYRVQIGHEDFNLSSFGNPLNIRVMIKENGEVLDQKNYQYISGKRGEREFEKPIVWTINFDPKKNYQIVLYEDSIIADATGWSIPGTPKMGYWPIGENGGKIYFGENSYLQFRDKIAQ